MRSGSTKRTPSQTRALCRMYVCSHINVLYTRRTHGVILLIYQHTHTQATMCVLSSTWPARTGIVCKRFAVHKGAQARAAFFALRKIVGRRIDLDCSALVVVGPGTCVRWVDATAVVLCCCWQRWLWWWWVFVKSLRTPHVQMLEFGSTAHVRTHAQNAPHCECLIRNNTHTTIVLCTAAYL